MNKIFQKTIEDIKSRRLPDGSFCDADGGPSSPEATAWAVIALRSCDKYLEEAMGACDWLASMKQDDGRVTAVNGCNEAFWPTPVCILAWKCFSGYHEPASAGINFLLDTQGQHFNRKSGTPTGHDTSIVGWPWIDNTHSWIEPTSLSVIALKSCGYKDHSRTMEAVKMILDRQLTSGGWNYGNTYVFGKELLPIHENTGQALCALSEMTSEDAVAGSLKYLETNIRKVRTPMALSWMIQGLGLWSKLPANWEQWVVESLKFQKRYGSYNTALLSMLIAVFHTKGKVNDIFV